MARSLSKVSVTAKRASFWRCGKSFSSETSRTLTVVSDAEFDALAAGDKGETISASQLDVLRNEPALIVARADDDAVDPPKVDAKGAKGAAA